LLTIELVYFTGCPHVHRARRALREALIRAGLPEHWREWNQLDPASPERIQGYPSPTILVAGQDIVAGPAPAAAACRVEELASIDALCAALLSALHSPAQRAPTMTSVGEESATDRETIPST
jgi:hypothetical protein